MNINNITPTNGFDLDNLNNARQNNYAWSMSDLGEYIYVGTGRNIPYGVIKLLAPGAQIPILINPNPIDNLAEIWRYKKDGTLSWERVFNAPNDPLLPKISGFRFMIKHRPSAGDPCIYAATFGTKVQILKTTNGVNWFILDDTVLQGTSSRAMIIQNEKVYVATINEGNPGSGPLLYSSKDPEFYPWKKVITTGTNPSKNPTGAISNMAVFNNKIYVATSNSNGVAVWRTNGVEPDIDEWSLIVDKGFGDSANKYSLSIGVFRNHLYVSGTKELPLAWVTPRGFDLIRIDKEDNWQLVVGGTPLIPSTPSKGVRRRSLSGLGSGFNNPFNVYAWQIQEYKGRLLISTFDNSSNLELILDTILANRIALARLIGVGGEEILELIIKIFQGIIKLLNKIKYPFGFDLYDSSDGINFYPVFLNGLYNRNNYGGRILFVDHCNELYLGTANPFQGCEVWSTSF